jgi:tight adherence protein C
LFAFVAVTLGIAVVGSTIVDRPSHDRQKAIRRLRELGGNASPETIASGIGPGWVRLIVSRLGSLVGVSKGLGSERLQERLNLAGYSQPSAVVYYRGIQFVLIIALALGASVGATMFGVAWLRVLVWAFVGGTLGFLSPSYVLSMRMHGRQRLMRSALPDALDIMVLCVEGGSSLNAAVSWVTEEIEPVHPMLGREMQIVQREMQLGLSAGDAFRGLADRCGIMEARDLAATLLQSERYGASVAKTLRAYADTARHDRQVWAEEMAHKAAVKIMFPMLICIFPAMFIVLLGPAASQMATLFAR